MTGLILALLGVAAAAVALWCAWTATRLDRLHLLCDSARAGLVEALLRRAAAATDLALSGRLDPASSLALAAAAEAARDQSDDDWQPQSDLSAVIRMVQTSGEGPNPDVDRAGREVSIARRIHNDLVVRTQDLRQRRRVRWFHLAGHAPAPLTIEFDALDT